MHHMHCGRILYLARSWLSVSRSQLPKTLNDDWICENRPYGHKYRNPFSVGKSHTNTHALSKDTKHLRQDGLVCLYRKLFSDTVKPPGCISWPVWPLRGINKTAWGGKLILTADLACPVSCVSLGHLLMAQHCYLFECLL